MNYIERLRTIADSLQMAKEIAETYNEPSPFSSEEWDAMVYSLRHLADELDNILDDAHSEGLVDGMEQGIEI